MTLNKTVMKNQMADFKETELIELKRQLNDGLTREIVAFLNTNGGTIFIGIEDDGSICGVQNLDETMRKIADIIENQILPDISNYVSLGTQYFGGKYIVKIEIKKGSALYYVKKFGRSAQGCFVRVGTTVRSMSEEKIEAEQLKNLISKADITEMPSKIVNPTFQYLKILLAGKEYSINEDTFEENFRLRTNDGKYNKEAELLADVNEVSIKVVRFAGKTKGDGILLRNEYGNKCLIVAMQQVFDYVGEVINETSISFDKGFRHNNHLFDKNAFREAWFNDCLHNLWADGTPPAVYIFTDRLEIISTGGLPANLSKNDFFKGVSKPVNEELAKLFIRLDLMEQTGYGVPFVVKTYGENAYEFLDGFIRVTIPFAAELNTNNLENNLENKSLTPLQKQIIKAIIKNRFITQKELLINLKIANSTLTYNVKRLKELQIIKRVGSKKTGFWEFCNTPKHTAGTINKI